MSKKREDGGAAFGHGSSNGHCCGASLRDYFAGQALAGLMANPAMCAAVKAEMTIRAVEGGEVFATAAYQQADAMLAARKAAP